MAFDILRHTVFRASLHSPTGFALTYAVVAVAAVAVSSGVFGVIGRLQRRVAEQNRQLLALNAVARAAVENPRLEKLLEAGLARVLAALAGDAGLICLVDLEKEEHTAVCNHGFSPELARELQRAKLESDPIAQQVVRTRQPVVLEHLFDDPRVAEVARREGIRSAVSSPLTSDGEVMGILVVAARQERRFSDGDQAFLGVIGGQLGLAIRNAALYEQSRAQNRELSALLTVGKVVTASLDMDEVLQQALDTVLEVTDAVSAEIWLREGDDLVPRLRRGDSPEAFLQQPRISVAADPDELTVPIDGVPVVMRGLSDNGTFIARRRSDTDPRTVGAMPLHYQGQLAGLLIVTAHAVDALAEPWELRILAGIGEWVVLAVENARLREQIQNSAILHERERIARELHDGLGQVLGSIITRTLTLKKLLSDERVDAARVELATMEEMARDRYADVREAILGLRTAPHEQGGLIPALRQYVDRYADATGIAAELEVCPSAIEVRLPPHVEIQLIRILQEALSNVRKHAKARSVRIDIARAENSLRATVVDDGRGFDARHLGAAGWPRFGLQTMRERAEAIGGTFVVESVPGRGSTVLVDIPLCPSSNGSSREGVVGR